LTTSLADLIFLTQNRWSTTESRVARWRLVEVVDLSTVATDRRLPVRVAPVPGEAIDSWLEATAGGMGRSLGAVVRALDLPLTTRPGWIRWLSLDQLKTVEATTGVSSTIVEAMTLSVYDGTAVPRADRTQRRVQPGVPGPRTSCRASPGLRQCRDRSGDHLDGRAVLCADAARAIGPGRRATCRHFDPNDLGRDLSR
jgi:TniQ protein